MHPFGEPPQISFLRRSKNITPSVSNDNSLSYRSGNSGGAQASFMISPAASPLKRSSKQVFQFGTPKIHEPQSVATKSGKELTAIDLPFSPLIPPQDRSRSPSNSSEHEVINIKEAAKNSKLSKFARSNRPLERSASSVMSESQDSFVKEIEEEIKQREIDGVDDFVPSGLRKQIDEEIEKNKYKKLSLSQIEEEKKIKKFRIEIVKRKPPVPVESINNSVVSTQQDHSRLSALMKKYEDDDDSDQDDDYIDPYERLIKHKKLDESVTLANAELKLVNYSKISQDSRLIKVIRSDSPFDEVEGSYKSRKRNTYYKPPRTVVFNPDRNFGTDLEE
ncbi:unnamed protein product [Moneuplotes crassus]|uniref:Uncharacterized protein n=1 Tax=Euplotes crassus TaxID=5936 RepID=A0AAD1UBU7_EUPCR|nr:unnamed protein product [Moneuplotes crassus]